MNDVLKAIRNRRTIRKFKPEGIDAENIQAVLEAGRWAPSFSNLQPWRFVVIQGEALKKDLEEAAKESVLYRGLREAPVVIVVCVDCGLDPQHALESGAAATQNMALAAQSLGLGAGWIGIWGTKSEKPIHRLLDLPEKMKVVSLVPIGTAGEAPVGQRKPLDTFVQIR